jgi:hypothetical protein
LRFNRAGLLGALTGVISASSVYLPIGEFPGLTLHGACIGLVVSGHCQGMVLGLYLGPGLVFGVVFGALLHRAGRFGRRGAAGFALASLVANSLAVMAALDAFQLVQPVFGGAELPSEAAAGLIAGTIGGGLLGRVTAVLVPGLRWGRLAAVGALLGLLLPLALAEHLAPIGVYVFFALWQGGYAVALATARRAA